MAGKVYLPNVSGMLRAYAEIQPQIAGVYKFMPFLFMRQRPEEIIKKWENPSVLVFSSSMWNHQLNLYLSRKARELFPQVLIIFGGPQISARVKEFLEQNPSIDVAVRGEGEVTFAALLTEFINGRDFSKVAGIFYRHPETNEIIQTHDRELVNVDNLPSPYLAGLYDDLLDHQDGIEYQVILETNRGCPFRCSFCYWGNGTNKIRMFDIDRVKKEIDWIAQKRIQYVFGADANFGMLLRDREIAEFFVESKKLSGYPRSFRVCYGKNATDRIFEVAKLLEANGLTKGVTVSFQSVDQQTLVNIGRKNIKIDAYRDLLRRYRSEKIRVYTELLLGLPGETYESFALGIEEVFQAGLYDQVGIFFCEVLSNTEMDDRDYIARHGMQMKRLELVEPHAVKRSPGEIPEYEDIVVTTRSMSLSDWKRSAMLAWMAQSLHGLKLGFFIALYLFQKFGIKYTEFFEYLIRTGADSEHFPIFAGTIAFYEEYLENILHGKPQCVFMDEYGTISWQIEEATFLRISENLNGFYGELESLVINFLESKNINFVHNEVKEVVLYQFARMASLDPNRSKECRFCYNIPEYFDRLLNDLSAIIIPKQQKLVIKAQKYNTREEFAKQVIWFVRRDCRAIEAVDWY